MNLECCNAYIEEDDFEKPIMCSLTEKTCVCSSCSHLEYRMNTWVRNCPAFLNTPKIEQPYLMKTNICKIRKYNPKYGDDRVCKCGHSYYRHFDTYEDMETCGCKYCGCFDFEEAKEEIKRCR